MTFNDIADHLRDYVDRYPADREAVERLACFLAEVERVCHDHNAHPTRGLAGIPEREVPRV